MARRIQGWAGRRLFGGDCRQEFHLGLAGFESLSRQKVKHGITVLALELDGPALDRAANAQGLFKG